MPFKKGHPGYNKGKPMSEEHKRKIGLANRGKVRSEEARKKVSLARTGKKSNFTGHKHSEESKRIIGIKGVGRVVTSETRKKIGDGHRGIPRSKEIREKIRKAHIGKPKLKLRGENHYRWKGGDKKELRRLRFTLEYRIWRRAVFERDNFTCVWCGAKFIKGVTGRVIIHADHIKPFAYFPELRFAIDNGRTLCVPCHKKTDTYGSRYKKEEINRLRK